MTDIVNPPAAPTVPPYPALGSANFNGEAYTFGSSMPGVAAGIQAMCQAAWTNAVAAQERAAAASASAGTATQQADAAMGYRNQANAAASTATTRRDEAAGSAAAAEASRIEASKLNLGNKTAPPTTDNQGQTLRAGATYYDTSLGKWRVWTGSAWGEGISTVAGVTSLNGETGDLAKSTLEAYGITDGAKKSTTLAGYGIKDAQSRLAPLEKSGNFAAEPGGVYLCDTRGGSFACVLPASPPPGCLITIVDMVNTFDIANLTVQRNGNPFYFSAEDYVLDQKGQGRTFMFLNQYLGWVVYA